MLDYITINAHSSIRIASGKVLYFDPFQMGKECEKHDADIIFVTHDHFDHFSPEDIKKVIKADTTFVAPTSTVALIKEAFPGHQGEVIAVAPGECLNVNEIDVEAVTAYTPGKPFHPKEENWVGYVVNVEGMRHYICGDTYLVDEIQQVKCDVLLVPVGGTYTMDAGEGAKLAEAIQPKYAIPMHFGEVAGGPLCGGAFAEEVKKAGIDTQVVLKL